MPATIESAAPQAPPAWAHETFQATFELYREQAVAAYAHHVIEPQGPGEWWCRTPGTQRYNFRVILRPGTVIVYGDSVNAIFRDAPSDPLPWLRGCVADNRGPDTYLCEKLSPRREEFYPGDALSYAAELAAEEPEHWSTVLTLATREWRHGNLTQSEWSELVMEYLGDPEYCSVGTKPESDTVRAIEALRWFCAHLPADGGKAGE